MRLTRLDEKAESKPRGLRAVIEGAGAVSGSPVASGNTVTVALSGVADRQTVAVMLSGVTPAGGGTASEVTVSFTRLAGDLNQDRVVNSVDISRISLYYGQTANATNFSADANCDGVINSVDLAVIRANYGGSALSFEQAFDFAFTGHFYHSRSELALALHRAYDAKLGRWGSWDPIGEAGGINLYGYVENNPINYIDQLGLIGGNHGGPKGPSTRGPQDNFDCRCKQAGGKVIPRWQKEGYSSAVNCANELTDTDNYVPDVPAIIRDSLIDLPVKAMFLPWLVAFGSCLVMECSVPY